LRLPARDAIGLARNATSGGLSAEGWQLLGAAV
jgi:hypothetical protein